MFRREYRYAWRDVCESHMDLPTNLSIAVSRHGQLESLKGSHRNPPELVVTNELSRFETKALMEAGHAILDVGEASLDAAVSALANSAGFKPLRLADVNVQLVVDGLSFIPSASDPLLVDVGLDWLPQAAVVGHELLAQQLEKAIPSSRIEARIRAIRLRRCEQISLLVNGKEVSAYKDHYYAFEHDDVPTLILANELSLDWRTLARVANSISRLIDVRLRSFSRLISDLVIQRDKQNLEAPTNEDLAAVLHVDPEIVEEHILELRADTSRIVQLLFPVIAYCGGGELARQFRATADLQGVSFDLEAWLSTNFYKLESIGKNASEIIDGCKRVVDHAELRRVLQLDFARFNRVLEELAEPLISNEEDLRRSYQAYLQELKPDIIDRLRRHYFATYSSGADLVQYVEHKTLSFLPFNQSWIAAYDSLELELVKTYTMNSISPLLGEDIAVSLRPLDRLLDANRKTAAKAAKETSSIVAAWCAKNNRQEPDLWRSGDMQGVVRHLESGGLLDFEVLSPADFPKMCRRAECWPLGMPEATNKNELGIGENDLAEERARREEEHRQTAVVSRTIVFADTPLDTGAGDFIEKFRDIAGQAISSDTSWLDRSSSDELELKSLPQTQNVAGSSGGGTGSWRRNVDAQLTDSQRLTMGLAGEWLAYQFLRNRHGKYVSEDCWISTNRQRFCGGTLGDDAAGFDFCVHTPRVDWLYEVKSTLAEGSEFEITANELRVASAAAKDRSRRYRILYVQHVFSPSKWFVLVLPNPMGEKTRQQFQTIGHGALRLRFEKR